MPESFQEQLKRLRGDRGISRGVLSRRTVKTGDMGISEQTIEALERNPRQRPLDRTIRVLGDALEASDEEFPAYALAKGRALLDEHVVGFDEALANLAKVRAALGLETEPPTPEQREAAAERLRAREREEAQQSRESRQALPRTSRAARARPARDRG